MDAKHLPLLIGDLGVECDTTYAIKYSPYDVLFVDSLTPRATIDPQGPAIVPSIRTRKTP
jgi:hypothetical protein